MRIALTIAGSDSGGGAGIQADLKTFHRFGLFGTSVLTAITAQNTVGVTRWTAVSADLVRAQLDSVATDLRPAATKSGMLADVSVVATVADAIREHRLTPYVLDPVMVATSGDLLLEQSAITTIRRDLIPLADLVTPNLDEASILASEPVRDIAAMERAAQELVRAGARAALIKGGHLCGAETLDLLFDGETTRIWRHPRISTRNTHGTGCTYSAAITALCARGKSLSQAVRLAKNYISTAISNGHRVGKHWVLGPGRAGD